MKKARMTFTNRCGTARKTKEILEQEGYEVETVDYLAGELSRDELVRLYSRAGMTAHDGLRAKEEIAKELGLTDAGVSEERIIDAMMEHPILINRPIVVGPKGARLCRPSEEVLSVLDRTLDADFVREDGEVVPANG